MPRTAKRQAPAAAPGQGYGEAGAQVAAQQEVGLPDMKAPAPAAGAAPGGAPGGAPDMAMALEAAQAMAPPEAPPWAAGPMGEQVTAGLPSGPGPGPEALTAMAPRRVDVAQILQQMAATTGNPYFAEIAQEAAARDLAP